MENKVSLEKIIEDNIGFVSTNNRCVYNIYDLKDCMLEFGKKLLELAAENAESSYTACGNNYKDNINIDKQSILDTIKQVE